MFSYSLELRGFPCLLFTNSASVLESDISQENPHSFFVGNNSIGDQDLGTWYTNASRKIKNICIYKQYIIIFKTQTVNSGLLIEAFSPLTFKVIDIFKVNN